MVGEGSHQTKRGLEISHIAADCLKLNKDQQHAELDEQSKEADAAKLGTAVAKALKTSGKAKDKQEPEF